MGWEVAARAILAPGAAMQPGPWSCHAISAWMMVNSACLAAFSQNSIFLQMEMPMRQAASNSPEWSPDGIKLSALQNSVRSFQADRTWKQTNPQTPTFSQVREKEKLRTRDENNMMTHVGQ